MNINFELYKIFYSVANEKSISKASKELMISQPAVTQSIKTLENQLGGILFVRTPKGVILTNEGEELYKFVKEGMNYLVNGTNKFMSLKDLNSGVLKIGASTSISEHFLMPYLNEFHSKYPNIEIKINNSLTDDLIKDLRNGNIDLVIMALPNTKVKDIDIKVISDLHDIFISNSKYDNIDIIELLKKPIIIQQTPSITRTNFNKFIIDNHLTFNPFMEIVSHNLLVNLVLNNFGVGVATKEFILDELASNKLFEIKTNLTIPKRQLGYAILKNSIPNFSALKFIEILKKG